MLMGLDEVGYTCQVTVSDGLYHDVLDSIRRSGVGFTFSKHGHRRVIQDYEGEPHEMLCGLPMRKLVNHKTLVAEPSFRMNPDSHLAPFMKECLAKGMSVDEATSEALVMYHVSQGRSRETIPEAHRPVGNCAYCHKRENKQTRFKKCGACKMALYCCQECQASHWETHRPTCKKNRQ